MSIIEIMIRADLMFMKKGSLRQKRLMEVPRQLLMKKKLLPLEVKVDLVDKNRLLELKQLRLTTDTQVEQVMLILITQVTLMEEDRQLLRLLRQLTDTLVVLVMSILMEQQDKLLMEQLVKPLSKPPLTNTPPTLAPE